MQPSTYFRASILLKDTSFSAHIIEKEIKWFILGKREYNTHYIPTYLELLSISAGEKLLRWFLKIFLFLLLA